MIDSISSSDSQTETPSGFEDGSRRTRNRLFAAAILLLVLIIVVPPFININRFRRSIIHSVSAGLGRPVEASSVELQLLPRPGFILHNLTISEDPAYGAEPVMVAETVAASLRASTLWHRRVEIASLRIKSPSVNLVRNLQGRWNFESLFVNSPVLQQHRTNTMNEPMPFPYVEATDARINFKLGPEKLPFSLQNANLIVWKQSSHEWRMRIRARPTRTDLSVADAGEIRGVGTLMSGSALMDAPVFVRLEWRHVQLGEISRLIHGEDEGWRGAVDWTARGIGTLSDISLTSDIAVEEFRRAEFVPSTEMDLSAHCAARYARYDLGLDSLKCSAPLGSGQFLLQGKFPGAKSSEISPTASLSHSSRKSVTRTNRVSPAKVQHRTRPADTASFEITLKKAPASFFLDLFGHIHPGVSHDASVSGQINGNANCVWHGLSTLSTCRGEIQSTELRLGLPNLDRALVFSPVQLVASQDGDRDGDAHSDGATPVVWKLSPSHVGLGGMSPATLTGELTSSGSLLQLRGMADLNELSKLAQSLKIPAFSGGIQSIRGTAELALSLQSSWLPQAVNNPTVGPIGIDRILGNPSAPDLVPSRWTGNLQLQNATLHLSAFPLGIQLTSAQVDILPAAIQWSGLTGTVAHIPFRGSFYSEVPCASAASTCSRNFELHAANLNVSRLQAALTHNDDSSNLVNLINSWTGSTLELPEITGTLNVDDLSVGKISLRNAVLKLKMKGHEAQLMGISGEIFNGKLSGEETTTALKPAPANGKTQQEETGSMQWGDGSPVYTLRATLQRIEPDSVAAIWDEHWGPGTANLKIDVKTHGWSASDLAQNASGKFSLSWLHGGLSTADTSSATANPTEKFQQWDAKGMIRDQKLVLGSSQMIPPIQHSARPQQQIFAMGAQSVTGTINFSRVLDLKLRPSGISIKGPISLPTISVPKKSEAVETQDQ